ncbi:MAG: helix-turn-helix domain-containing protein [Gammaproteobacteria bacterium]|nr:helix-turn-helix domain-containing protein [Gammaproteobacteria bacterium]
MNTQIENISKVWPSIKSVFSVPHSDKDYQSLVKTLDNLIDEIGDNENHELSPVMEIIGKLIESYEEQSFVFKKSSAIDALKYLMKEHNLKQSDLKEIGSQGVVSEVLTGTRILNIEQIKKVSARFHVSPLVFI